MNSTANWCPCPALFAKEVAWIRHKAQGLTEMSCKVASQKIDSPNLQARMGGCSAHQICYIFHSLLQWPHHLRQAVIATDEQGKPTLDYWTTHYIQFLTSINMSIRNIYISPYWKWCQPFGRAFCHDKWHRSWGSHFQPHAAAEGLNVAFCVQTYDNIPYPTPTPTSILDLRKHFNPLSSLLDPSRLQLGGA